MAIFAVTYTYSDDVAARDAHRPQHRSYLSQVEGMLLSGPLAEPDGALLVIAAPTREDVAERLDRDPFLLEGIVVERTIRPYTPVLGSQAPTFAEHLER